MMMIYLVWINNSFWKFIWSYENWILEFSLEIIFLPEGGGGATKFAEIQRKFWNATVLFSFLPTCKSRLQCLQNEIYCKTGLIFKKLCFIFSLKYKIWNSVILFVSDHLICRYHNTKQTNPTISDIHFLGFWLSTSMLICTTIINHFPQVLDHLSVCPSANNNRPCPSPSS